jgi:PAS domain S-box-containing protein/diguanylate cyclase (GGDEF)-like protein
MIQSLSSLKVLLVEDSAADAELVLRALRTLPVLIEHLRVDNESGLREGLAGFAPNIVLSDFSMPGFSGQEALTIVREQTPHVPFLFVSGTIGEELAIEALHGGAMDYVLKDNLRRLPSAVERALETAGQRSERVRIERALRESEERFRTIVESSQDWIWENEPSTRITYSNGALAQILGYQPDEIFGALAVDHMLPEDREQVLRRLPKLVAARRGWERWRLRWRHHDGSVRMLESTATPRFDADGELVGYRGVDHDITEQLRQENRIQRLVRIHAVLSALGNTILRARTRGELLEQACQVAVEQGAFEAACIGVPLKRGGLEVVASHGNQAVIALIERFARQSPEESSASHLRPGLLALHEARNVVVRDVANAELPADMQADMLAVGVAAEIVLPIGSPPWGVLGLFAARPQEFDPEEISLLERLTSEVDYAVDFIAKGERLEYMAYHNPITGLPNRTAFQQQVAALLAEGPLVVAVIDLANFGRINHSRGREFGDRLLHIAGQRLKVMLRPSAIVAHAGEDAFLFAQSAHGSIEDEVERLDALLGPLDETPFEIDGEQVFLHLNCGLAMSPEHGADYETLERNAAAALGEALKRKVRIEPFTHLLHERTAHRIELERNLHRAFDENQFELFYQPKFNAHDHRLVGAEALLRWRHPEVGLISPTEFIPLLEDTGLIVPAGHWVMRTALATALAWRAMGHAGLRIAVNVSARELRNLRFLDECRALLEPYAADQLLDIEVTESLLMDDIDQSIALLQGLRDLGCRIAIDDFGTGYSSLNYLARLPVDVIKIDQSFIAQLAHSPETMSLITNIITLVHSLSLKVVAEGVEEEEQVKLLRLLRCDELQGYLLGRPMPASDFVSRLLL